MRRVDLVFDYSEPELVKVWYRIKLKRTFEHILEASRVIRVPPLSGKEWVIHLCECQ